MPESNRTTPRTTTTSTSVKPLRDGGWVRDMAGVGPVVGPGAAGHVGSPLEKVEPVAPANGAGRSRGGRAAPGAGDFPIPLLSALPRARPTSRIRDDSLVDPPRRPARRRSARARRARPAARAGFRRVAPGTAARARFGRATRARSVPRAALPHALDGARPARDPGARAGAR